MRITTFSNNKLFGGQNARRGKQTDNGAGRSVVADMAQRLEESAQKDLQQTAAKQATVSRRDKVELSIKKGSAEYAARVYKALTGVDNKQAFEEQMQAQAAKAMQEMLQENAEKAKDEVEAAKEAMEYMLKMMEIARRISSGGQVPGSDEQKLLEYSQVLYTMAKMMAMQAKEHEKYDSVFEDEEQQTDGGASAANSVNNIEGMSEVNVGTSCDSGGAGGSGAVLAGD